MSRVIKMSTLSIEIRENIENYPEYVYVGRPSIWGNPYTFHGSKLATQVSSLEEALTKYETYLLQSPQLLEKLSELCGKILVCWCTNCEIYNPKKKIMCHAQILQKYVSRLEMLQNESPQEW